MSRATQFFEQEWWKHPDRLFEIGLGSPSGLAVYNTGRTPDGRQVLCVEADHSIEVVWFSESGEMLMAEVIQVLEFGDSNVDVWAQKSGFRYGPISVKHFSTSEPNRFSAHICFFSLTEEDTIESPYYQSSLESRDYWFHHLSESLARGDFQLSWSGERQRFQGKNTSPKTTPTSTVNKTMKGATLRFYTFPENEGRHFPLDGSRLTTLGIQTGLLPDGIQVLLEGNLIVKFAPNGELLSEEFLNPVEATTKSTSKGKRRKLPKPEPITQEQCKVQNDWKATPIRVLRFMLTEQCWISDLPAGSELAYYDPYNFGYREKLERLELWRRSGNWTLHWGESWSMDSEGNLLG